MEALLAFLPVLVCPLMMGAMLWLMHRNNADHPPTNTADRTNSTTPVPTARVQAGRYFHLCLNWKIVCGLAVLGGAVWFAAPGAFWTALPILALLACPLSMLVMMRGMSRDRGAMPLTRGFHGAAPRARPLGEHSVVLAETERPTP